MHLICLAGWVLRMQILRQNVGARCLLVINTCEEEERKQTWTGKNLRRPWPTQEAALKRLLPIIVWGGSLVAQSIKNLPAMQETQVWSLNQEDTLEKEMAFHSSNSCLGNPVDRGAWWATVHGVAESDTAEWLTHTHIHTHTHTHTHTKNVYAVMWENQGAQS